MPDVWSLAELRVHGFAARWHAGRRAAEGGDERADQALAAELARALFRPGATAIPRSSPTRCRAWTRYAPTTGSASSPTGAGCPRRSDWPATSSRWSSRRTTAWPSRTRGSSKWWSANSVSGPRSACWWVTTRSTTSRVRTVQAGARCGSTAPAPSRSPPTARARCRGRIVGRAVRRAVPIRLTAVMLDPLRRGSRVRGEVDLRRLLGRCHLLGFDSVADFDAASRIYRLCVCAGVTPWGLVDLHDRLGRPPSRSVAARTRRGPGPGRQSPRDRNGRGVDRPLSRRYLGRGTWKKQVPRTSIVPSSFRMCTSAMAIARPLRTI